MRTAVLIHGFHLDSALKSNGVTYYWLDMAIGRIGHGEATGRATYGTLLAYRERAELIIFSTGASSRDGVSEARHTYNSVLGCADHLGKILDISDACLRSWLEHRVELDETSQTTQEELGRNLRRCADGDFKKIILVTNKFHAPRAIANANEARRKLGLELTIMAACPDDFSPPPTIFEPPTRPDRPSLPWNELLQGVFRLRPESQQDAYAEIAAVLERHKT